MSTSGGSLAPDISFGENGQTQTDMGVGTNDRVTFTAQQADGKLLAIGFTNQQGDAPQIAVVRYTADGILDTTFSGDGKMSTIFPGGSGMGVWAGGGQLADGKISVFALHSSNTLVHMRLNADGSLDTTFDTDGFSQISLGTYGLFNASFATTMPGNATLVSFNGAFKLAKFMANVQGTWDMKPYTGLPPRSCAN